MSLKAELETQAAALKAYDEQDFEKALQIFETIADTSKIHTNIGLILATLGEHEAAVDSFNAATELDRFLAVAYFQCGVSNFLLGRFEYALKDFEEALAYLRGNQNINYEQLGLKFKLHAAEVLFNKGLCHMYLGDEAMGMQEMRAAQQSKAIPEHNVIDDAIRDKGEEYTVFSIPVGVLYRPSETKLRNAKTKDYLGKAKLISAADARDEFTAFTGVTRLKQGQLPSGAPLDITQTGPQSFSGLSRSASARAAGGDDNKSPPANISRSVTTSAIGTNGVTRGLSLRYATPAGSNAPPAGGGMNMNMNGDTGVATLTRQVTQLNIRDRNQPPLPPAASQAPPPRPQQQQPPPASSRSPPPPAASSTRLTEIYDDYYGGRGEEEPLPADAANRVAQWASKTSPGTPSTSPPPIRGPSANDRLRQNVGVDVRRGGAGGGSVRRRGTARSAGGNMSKAPSSYATSSRQDRSTVYDDDEEEGYISGNDYDGYTLTKLRVKIHFDNEIRGMTLPPDLSYDAFLDKVCAKFNQSSTSLTIKFADEDGNKVSLMDDSDFDLAMEVARDTAKGKGEGKLELWCAKR